LVSLLLFIMSNTENVTEKESILVESGKLKAPQQSLPRRYSILPSPSVQRTFNRPLVLIMMLSLVSFLAILFVVFSNMFLQFIYAIYVSWTLMDGAEFFFWTIAALWLMIDFSFVFIIIFGNLWSYCRFVYACKFDEHLDDRLDLPPQDKERLNELIGLTEWKTEKICCFEITAGTLYRSTYLFMILLLTPIVFVFTDTHTEASHLIESAWVASTLSGFIYLSFMFLLDYSILLREIHKQRLWEVDNSSKQGESPRCWVIFQRWMLWILSSNPYLKENKLYLRSFIVLSELFIAPTFITLMFFLQSHTGGTLAFCVTIPILRYILRVLNAFRRDSGVEEESCSEDSDDRCESHVCQECCTDKFFDTCFDTYCAPVWNWLTFQNLYEAIARKRSEICFGIVLLLLASSFIYVISLVMLDGHETVPLTESSSFPACKLKFEFGDDILGPTEMALFAKWAYMDPAVRYEAMDYFLGGENYDIILRNSIRVNESGTQFFHVESKRSSSNITDNFVVIRGTSTISDCLQDMKMWTEISSIQMVNILIPLLTFWPISFTNNLIEILSGMQDWMGGPVMVDYLEPVSKHVSEFLPSVPEYLQNPENSTHRFMTIGHSLGGGIASLVASREYEPYRREVVPPRVSSFGLSPVGTMFSSSKFGGSWWAVEETATSIFSRRDPVPMVDSQGGLTEKIPCTQPFFFQCHSSLVTICELHRQCKLPLDGKNRAKKENMLNCMCCVENIGDVTPTEYCAQKVQNVNYNRSCEISLRE